MAAPRKPKVDENALPVSERLIVSLCDASGSWSAPYAAAGYRVVLVDLAHAAGVSVQGNVTRVGADVLDYEFDAPPWAVLAAPPCTCFCRPGARWWARQDADGSTERDVRVLRRCLHLCREATAWWALENPPGRHRKLVPELGEPAWQFQPFEHGDPWWKQTYIWGTAERPAATSVVVPVPTYRTPNGKTQGRVARMSSSWAAQRARTPDGFARAFFAVNP